MIKSMLISLLLLLTSSALMADENVKFSDYTSNLKIKEISYGMPHVQFSGQLEIKGTLVFRLDRLSETEFGEPIFADFFPNEDQRDLFPQVIEGRYAKKLESIGIININEAYKQAFGELQKHDTRKISVSGVIIVEDYTTTIECDARQYFARMISIKVDPDIASEVKGIGSGC